jgi:hypothetical protein
MKKIAFFVEGQTEQFFLNKLLIEVAGAKKIRIKLRKFGGKGKLSTENIFPKTSAQGDNNVNHFALIYDCGGDESVKSRILEEYQDLLSDGFSEIIGFRDLFPLTDINKLEDILSNGRIFKGKRIEKALPMNAKIIVAVREVEDWFLAECHHYTCIDVALTHSLIVSKVGFDPCVDDLSSRSSSAADDLKKVYKIVGKTYDKDTKRVERTVECLDYDNLYIDVKSRIAKLNELISVIDVFLS